MTIADWGLLICGLALGAILMHETGRMNRLTDELARVERGRDVLLEAAKLISKKVIGFTELDRANIAELDKAIALVEGWEGGAK